MTTTDVSLTIVMYHYVRPIAGSAYPGIKGLELEEFEGQLEYLCRHYTPVTVEQLARAQAGDPLPDRALLLTFDDGFVDHVNHVAPRLAARGISGAFFPPSCAVDERRLLDVHRLQHLLAVTEDAGALVAALEEALVGEAGLEPLAAYRERCWRPSRYDPAEVMFVKGMLQYALPQPLRSRLLGELFVLNVSAEPAAFAEELYMSRAHLEELIRLGMHVGSHGHDHVWLEHTPSAGQAAEIARSQGMLEAVGALEPVFSFCYPFGSYDATTLELLANAGCTLGFTTQVGVARPASERDWLTLPRLDTNDFPTDPGAPPNRWVKELGR